MANFSFRVLCFDIFLHHFWNQRAKEIDTQTEIGLHATCIKIGIRNKKKKTIIVLNVIIIYQISFKNYVSILEHGIYTNAFFYAAPIEISCVVCMPSKKNTRSWCSLILADRSAETLNLHIFN